MAEEMASPSIDKVKRDIQAKYGSDSPLFGPMLIRFDAIEPQEDGKFFVSFEMISQEDKDIRAKHTGDVWYDEDGQLNVEDLFPL